MKRTKALARVCLFAMFLVTGLSACDDQKGITNDYGRGQIGGPAGKNVNTSRAPDSSGPVYGAAATATPTP